LGNWQKAGGNVGEIGKIIIIAIEHAEEG
jgi:hypothetical protein